VSGSKLKGHNCLFLGETHFFKDLSAINRLDIQKTSWYFYRMNKNQSFFTAVNLPKTTVKIKHEESILLIGSCFAENIAEKLTHRKFNVVSNPSGIIYNPVSITTSLKRVLTQKLYSESDLIDYNGKWLSFDHHSFFSNSNKEACLAQINEQITATAISLKSTQTIFITFGSAWVYEYKDIGIVANCHKIPQKQFAKRLLSVKEILLAFDEIKKELTGFNVVFTVSPVRHVRDGLHENNLSKSTLHLAINNLVEQNKNYHYFPAYEMIVDELRDYRFFKDDLVHPTSLAINYVWDKFVSTYCNANTNDLIDQLEKINSAINHKPFDFNSEPHQQFIKKQVELMDKLTIQFPFLDFDEEQKVLKKG